MSRSKVLSALALAGLLAAAAGAQQPAKDEKPTKTAPLTVDKSATVTGDVLSVTGGEIVLTDGKPDPVAEAVRSHPDVRVAEAKLRVAEAELAQAKLLVAQRVTVAQAKLDDARIRAEHAAKALKRIQELRKTGAVPGEVVETHEKELALARAAVVAAEAELRTAQGVAPGRGPVSVTGSGTLTVTGGEVVLMDRLQQFDKRAELALEFLAAGVKAPPGSAADKLRGLIDKTVKMPELVKVRFPDAIEALKKAAGTDLEIRVPANWTTIPLQSFSSPAGEMSFAAWLDLMLDEWNAHTASEARLAVYVRGYGLLITNANFAPPGALPLADVIRQFRMEKAEPKKP